MPRRGVFFGWRVVAAAFVVAVFAWGTGFYGPSVFLHALHEGRGWPVSTISAAITCHFLLSAAIGTRLPALHNRFGIAATTRAAAVATALGALAWALAAEPWPLFHAALLSGAGWAGTNAAAISAMVAPWFERCRAAALAMAFNGASVGGVVFAPLWALLIADWGFTAAAAAIGAAMVAAVWWLAGRYLRPTPVGMGLAPDADGPGVDAPPTPEPSGTARPPLPTGAAAWRDRRFATLSIAFALGLFAQIGLVAHLFSLLAPALGAAGAGGAVSLTTACAVLGRTLLGALLPARADRRVAAAANFAVQVAGSLALLASGGSSVPLLLLGCVLFGLGVGNMISLPPLIAQAEFARGDVARVVALVFAFTQAVFAFAPAGLGALRDAADAGWAPVLAAALVQAGAAAAVLAGRKGGNQRHEGRHAGHEVTGAQPERHRPRRPALFDPRHPVAHLRRQEGTVDLGVEARHEVPRHVLRAEGAAPNGHLVAGHRFRHGRDLRKQPRAPPFGDAEQLEAPILHVAQRLRARAEKELRLPGDRVQHRRRAAAVRDVHHLDARHAREHRRAEMVGGAGAGRGVADLADGLSHGR